MRTVLDCPACGTPLWIESLECGSCAQPVLLDPVTKRAYALGEPGLEPCANRRWGCNWAVRAGGPHVECYSCRLTRRRPDLDDTVAMGKLAVTETAKRRLLIGLADLALPIRPQWVADGGLAFDLLASREGVPVVIGHADGVITIDLTESLDDHRERLRITLGEPYRTMLGHFRHEVGHYYQWQLVEEPGGTLLEECRTLFGDERASYAEALERHYRDGAPSDWPENYISSYATMHPWEDFAETFAHYQHILATLGITANGGLLMSRQAQPALPSDIRPRTDYTDVPMADALTDWTWVSHLLNRANHAMGKGDLYPFTIPQPVAEKLDFVHRVVVASRVHEPFIGLDAQAREPLPKS
ncbi:MAG: putative zinc-binding metallopeptidase [Propionicimonas sp.]|uniref:zinc-binding metallopeptidase family protein n=1 Tax=Propionicimonas sp. TaxID=1955623 RepID=UPI003D148C56